MNSNIDTQIIDDNRYINISDDWWKFIIDEVALALRAITPMLMIA